eukprot:gnl/TRDRNA2_/TRDRNA2_192211_c0_seq1.p1 gnl/TRDRNA2_/TRDRNA2_192211_c0~~gnl/TRDRNA2_/TRDRNA2_192211_c0_seq1.p1  ORF type:complete len:343 (+),score=57.59 gnl/TRDRNA2_/TRDRNA2_192211_c0_seq1:70-1098(+)
MIFAMGLPRTNIVYVLLVCVVTFLHDVEADTRGFLIVTAPRSSKVSYVTLPETGGNITNLKPQTLISTGVQHPQGVAVDHDRKKIYIADPDAKKIYGYSYAFDDKKLWIVGKQQVVEQGAEARWVAVDQVGNVFFSDEPRNMILKVSSDKVLRGDTRPEIVYSGNMLTAVNRPGGIAVDNFNVFWTNKDIGTQVGSLVEGYEGNGYTGRHAKVLAKNSMKSYGVCLAEGVAYFTSSEKAIYGVKKVGSQVTTISHNMDKPRGCVWDGDGTIFVADRGTGAVYSFANTPFTMHMWQPPIVEKAFYFEDAFGLDIVYANSASLRSALSFVSACVAMAAAVLRVF